MSADAAEVRIDAGWGVTVTVDCHNCAEPPGGSVLYAIGQVAGGMFQRVGPKWGMTMAGKYWHVTAAQDDGSDPPTLVLWEVGQALPRLIAALGDTQ